VGQRYGSTSVPECICTEGQVGVRKMVPTNEAIDAGTRNAYATVQRKGRIQSAERAVPTLSTTSKVTNLLSA